MAVVTLADVVKKRHLDQALNGKQFARLAGISYSQALDWFHLPNFPTIGGAVFWSDFVEWRRAHTGLTGFLEKIKREAAKPPAAEDIHTQQLPWRAARILAESDPGMRTKFTGRAARILREAGHKS